MQHSSTVREYTFSIKVNLSEDLTSIVKEQKYETRKTSFPCLGQLQVK